MQSHGITCKQKQYIPRRNDSQATANESRFQGIGVVANIREELHEDWIESTLGRKVEQGIVLHLNVVQSHLVRTLRKLVLFRENETSQLPLFNGLHDFSCKSTQSRIHKFISN